MNWHSEKIDEIYRKLESSSDGLSQEEADARLEEQGRNAISSGEEISPLKIFISQFHDFLIYLLIAAALVSIGIGFLPGHSPEYTDAALIVLILVANGLMGFIQEYKAEKSIQALKKASTPDAKVLRDGEKKEVDAENIVPGDIVFIEQGDAIPADARVIESQNLETDESALTGESANISKENTVLDEDTVLAERENMVFRNTTAVKGRGKAVVVETGMDTEVGSIAHQIEEADDRKTPFQKEVNELGRKIGYGVIGIIALVAVTQIFTTGGGASNLAVDKLVSILMVSITLAVAAVPEGLPAVVTLTLVLGSKKMLKKDALVRKLPVVESLGSVDYIVTDKTGTLTEGVMTVEKNFFGDEEFDVSGTGYETEGEFTREGYDVDKDYLRPLLECGVYCNNAERAPEEEDEEFYGDPTEIALLVSGLKADIENEKERIHEVPFSSDRKRMTVVTEDRKAYMKGAPSRILERCDRILENGEVKELTEEKKDEIRDKNHDFAEDALRVLGFAYREEVDPEEESDHKIEKNMVFLGLQGMIDPPRSEVRGAVEDCRTAGINTVMATGDNIETAKAIGEEIGFNPKNAMTGQELDELSDEEIEEQVQDTEIFARVSPENKVDILKGLQRNERNVAMTGDGVNDAPALKNSDVGVAMGQRGTDVAKQSADMILQDDNFVTIRDAIAEGRGIFDNIRKFVNYLLSANAGEVLVVFLGVMLGSLLFPDIFQKTSEAVILTPVMLLWMNFVTDGLPALALGADPKSKDIMNRDPRGKSEPVINKRIMASIAGIGLLIAFTGLPLFFYELSHSLAVAQTLLFTFLVVIEMVRIQTIRSRFDQSLLSNKWLVGALSSSFLLQLLVLYTPLRQYFETALIGLKLWSFICIATAGFIGLSFGLSQVLDHVFTD
ncbi:MAG: cation-translocating P-type ATPase [Candidatus Nanosalina sp.]